MAYRITEAFIQLLLMWFMNVQRLFDSAFVTFNYFFCLVLLVVGQCFSGENSPAVKIPSSTEEYMFECHSFKKEKKVVKVSNA